MGNRFGPKDILLFGTLALILVSIWTAMFQIDRQWRFIAATQDKLDTQLRDIAEIRRNLSSGALGSMQRSAAPRQSSAGFDRALAAANRPDYAEGDWLIDNVPANLQTLTPLVSSDTYATAVQNHVVESLLTRDPDTFEWKALIADDWQISDDGLTITMRIRQDVTYSDGTPVAAADVAFTFDFIMDERIAAPRIRAYLSRIDSVTAQDNEVVFRFGEPYFEALELAAGFPVLAPHFYARFLESTEAAEEFNNATGLLFGSGPYRLAQPGSWTPGDPLELVRNERYWGPVRPAFDRLVWKVIGNDTARLAEFRNGDIDLFSARPVDYQELKNDPDVRERADVYEFYDALGGYSFIAWNQQRHGEPTRFADRRVRQAMTLLTDRQRIVDEVLLGLAKPANGPFNPLGEQDDPNLPVRDFDLERARALLADAGFVDRDGDGIIESAAGEPFAFEFMYPATSDDIKRIVLLLKDLYGRAGILLEPEPTDWPIMVKALTDKDFEVTSLAWSSGIEIDVFQMFHSDQIAPGADNFIHYANPELDGLLERARAETDVDERMALWRAVHRVLWEDQPYTFLLRRQRLDFVAKRIRNVQRVRGGLNTAGRWSTPNEWYVPASLQRYSD